MAGNDVRKMADQTRDIFNNSEVIAIDQDALGKQGYRFMKHFGKQIWAKELAGGDWAVCYFNDSEESVQLRIDWTHLSFLKGTYRVRDVWQQKDLGRNEGEFRAPLPSHDVVVLRLTPVK
jgi:alpha-galactosidase